MRSVLRSVVRYLTKPSVDRLIIGDLAVGAGVFGVAVGTGTDLSVSAIVGGACAGIKAAGRVAVLQLVAWADTHAAPVPAPAPAPAHPARKSPAGKKKAAGKK